MNKTKISYKNKMTFIWIAFAFIITSSYLASAVNIGVSPSTLTFNNVLRGGYAEGSVVISSDSINETNVALNASGDIASWLNFTPNFNVSRNDPQLVHISITPPSDTPNGNYTGFIQIQSSTRGNVPQGNAVGMVKSVLDIYIKVQVVSTQLLQCSAEHFGVSSIEQGSNAIFGVNVTNTGNVIIKPRVTIQIWNEAQTQIVKSFDLIGQQILPTTKQFLSFTVNTASLPVSQYWAKVSAVSCLSSTLLTFDVLKPGTLRADGVLMYLHSPSTANIKETIPIDAGFKNTGEMPVSAQFKGQVTQAGNIVQLLNSPSQNIDIGKTGTFTFYFTPEKSGDYVISGRVYYSGKQSYEQSTQFSVSQTSPLSIILPIIYGFLVLVIAFLFLKILKEKKTYNKILKRLKNEKI